MGPETSHFSTARSKPTCHFPNKPTTRTAVSSPGNMLCPNSSRATTACQGHALVQPSPHRQRSRSCPAGNAAFQAHSSRRQLRQQHTAAAHSDHSAGSEQPPQPHLSSHQPGKEQQQQQRVLQEQQQFQQVLAEVQQLSYSEQQLLLEDNPEHRAFSASFLFWLSAQEKRAMGTNKKHLSQLAAQLVQLKEQAEYEASRRMLPPLASSLAYSNYSSWRISHNDQDLPEVTPGVTLTDLYKAAEREEAKLKQWQNPKRPDSTLDNFAAASGYAGFAADAMARVRARLAGFEDDDTAMQQQQQGPLGAASAGGGQGTASTSPQQQQGVSPAAARVLEELLLGCCCREERATLLPEACVPPGLEVSAAGAAGSSAGAAAVARVVTSPPRLLAAVAARLRGLDHTEPEMLPSGESSQQALLELQEDIVEYDTHVYSRLSQRDLAGL